jgi:hypothetical protein
MTKPKIPDPIEILTAEIQDYERQYLEAQAQIQNWTQKMFMASGAGQACKAVLARLESKSTNEEASAS